MTILPHIYYNHILERINSLYGVSCRDLKVDNDIDAATENPENRSYPIYCDTDSIKGCGPVNLDKIIGSYKNQIFKFRK